jgi:hypothetical protein
MQWIEAAWPEDAVRTVTRIESRAEFSIIRLAPSSFKQLPGSGPLILTQCPGHLGGQPNAQDVESLSKVGVAAVARASGHFVAAGGRQVVAERQAIVVHPKRFGAFVEVLHQFNKTFDAVEVLP